MDVKSFANTRVRFQRLRDAKIFTGWVRKIGPDSAVVHLRRAAEIVPGDQFAFQAFGPNTIANFRAELQVCYGLEMSLRLTSPVSFRKSPEDMRVSVEGTAGLLILDGAEYDMTLVDVSTSGAGVLCSVLLEKGDRVQLLIDSPQGQIICDAEVIYCKDSDVSGGAWRIGVTVRPENRIDTARWQRLLKAAA